METNQLRLTELQAPDVSDPAAVAAESPRPASVPAAATGLVDLAELA
jgi:hypothetical protein